MEVRFNIKLTEGQRQAYELAHRDDVKHLVLVYSRQCGKTVLAEILLIEQLFKKNSFSAYISPTFQLGRKVFKEICQLLENSGVIKKANATTLTIESTYGATLQFFSAEAYTAIRGTTVSGILIIDEAAYIKDVLPNGENFWGNVVMPLTKARHPLVVMISTPCGKRGFFYDFYLKAVAGEKGVFQLTRTIYDDDLISEEEIEGIKKSVPPLAFEQEFLTRFLDNALTVFPNFESCFDIENFSGGKCWCGIDPSSVGEDNTILTFINERNEVKQYKIDGTLDAKYSQIAKLINKYNPVSTYIESNSIGEVMANEIRKQLVRKANFKTFATTNESKKDYISLIAVAIANGDIHFERDNRLLYSEICTYTFKLTKTGNVTYAARDGFHDDTVSSLGIALQCKEDNKYITKNNINYIISNNGWIH